MKGECRVECKKKCKEKVKKGKCRVSAERQVQTRNPQRTQTRSVVATTCGYMGYRLFRRPQVLFLCVIVCVCVFGVMRLGGCGVASLWVRGLVFCGFVSVCVHMFVFVWVLCVFV